MALDFWWLEDRTATTQRVAFRCTADHAAVGVTGNTVAVAAVNNNDRTGYIDLVVTADAGTAELLVDGTPVAAINYPAFVMPTETGTIGFVGCQSQDYEFHAGHWLKNQCDVVIQTGDWIYETETYAQWGESGMTSCITNPTQANWFQHHRQPHRNPGWKQLGHKIPTLKMEDDHDVLDAWGTGLLPGYPTKQAVDAYVVANGGTDADALTAITGFMFNALDSYRHQGDYYAFDFGAARVIVPNLMRFRSSQTAVDDASKSMMGATQLAWFLGELSGPAALKIVVSTKVLFNGSNDDSWYPDPQNPVVRPGYKTELSTILKHIKTNAIKGVLWMTGDTHHPMVMRMTPQMIATKLGIGTAADYPHVVLFNPCPSGKIQDHTITAGPADGVIWKKQADGVGSGKYGDAVVGKVVVTPTHLQPEIWSISGKRIGYGIIDAGSNQMRHGWFLE